MIKNRDYFELNFAHIILNLLVECSGCEENSICAPIGVPDDDPVFGILDCLGFKRSRPILDADCGVETRNQENQITSYLDSSNVYGSCDEVAIELRDYTGGKKINKK